MKFLKRWIAKIAIKKALNKLEKTIDMNSSKTTIGGVLGGLSLILTQLWYMFDGIDATTMDVSQIIAGLGLLGLGWFARDNDKSSEEVGAK